MLRRRRTLRGRLHLNIAEVVALLVDCGIGRLILRGLYTVVVILGLLAVLVDDGKTKLVAIFVFYIVGNVVFGLLKLDKLEVIVILGHASVLQKGSLANALFQRALNIALLIAFGNGLALVMDLLTACDRDLNLHKRVLFEVHLRRDNRHTALANLLFDKADLFLMQKQLALAVGVDISNVTVTVRRDMNIVQPRLAPANQNETVGKLAIVLAKGSDFGSRQLDAGLEAFEDLVFVERTAILRDGLSFALHLTNTPSNACACESAFRA